MPTFIADNYFCDRDETDGVDLTNPLRDGQYGHGSNRACCTTNNPPWFNRELQPTTDDIEIRLCRDQNREDENILIEAVEIYVT